MRLGRRVRYEYHVDVFYGAGKEGVGDERGCEAGEDVGYLEGFEG